MTATESRMRTGFIHELAPYRDRDEYVDWTVPFIKEGLELGESVFVAVPSDKLKLIRPELTGTEQGRTRGEPVLAMVAMEEIGANPARIIPAWADFLAAPGVDGRVRAVGESVWAARSPEELVECEHHEALLNVAFLGRQFTLRCPYDAGSLPPAVIERARRTHPYEAGALPDAGHGTARVEAHPSKPLRPVPPAAVRQDFDAGSLARLRSALREAAVDAGLGLQRVDDLEVAVTELVSNSVRHGGGSGRLAWWREDGRFYCDVRDHGRLDDPLAGRRRPQPTLESGRGLWLVHQLCDLVQIRATSDGLEIRVQIVI